jgi:hypothetical protein
MGELLRAGHVLSVDEEPVACLAFAYPEVFSQELDDVIGRRPARQRLANPTRNLEQPVAVGWDACDVVTERRTRTCTSPSCARRLTIR